MLRGKAVYPAVSMYRKGQSVSVTFPGNEGAEFKSSATDEEEVDIAAGASALFFKGESSAFTEVNDELGAGSGARAELPHSTTEVTERRAGEPAEAGSTQEPR